MRFANIAIIVAIGGCVLFNGLEIPTINSLTLLISGTKRWRRITPHHPTWTHFLRVHAVVISAFCASIAATPARGESGGWLGIEMQPITKQDVVVTHGAASKCIKVAKSIDGSPAAAAGLVRDDLVCVLNGREFERGIDMSEAMDSIAPGETIELGVVRGGKQLKIAATLASYEASAKVIEKAAMAGDASAMTIFGYLYYSGRGVPKKYSEAHRWFLMAAAKGHPSAMNNLGVMYKFGEGVKKDEAASRSWFQRALEAGSVEAAENLRRQEIDKLAELLRKDKESPRSKLLGQLAAQLRSCWSPPEGSPPVTIKFKLKPDGNLDGKPQVVSTSEYAQPALTAALRAVEQCQPFRLPKEHYDAWKSIVWTFDTRKLF